jgi:hypothetical protein
MLIIELLTEYIAFIVFFITKVFKSNLMQVMVIFSMLMSIVLYNNFLSRKAIEKTFIQDYYNLTEKNTVLNKVIKNGIYVFYGDDIEASNFFIQIAKANNELSQMEKYKGKVKFYQFVINEKPSNPYQLNEEYTNNMQIKNNINSKTQEQIDKRFATMQERKRLYLDSEIDIKCISIYCKDGVNQDTFLNNVQKYKGKLIGKKVNCQSINEKRKGQIIVIKLLTTNSIFILREVAGEQAHNVGNSQHLKVLLFDNLNFQMFKSRYELRNKDIELYNSLQEFNLFSVLDF